MAEQWLLAGMVLAIMVVPAIAQQGSAMMDGIMVNIMATGDHLEISYIEPPAMLREVGVKEGSLVLSGHWEGGVLHGQAYVYAPSCPAIPYTIRAVANAYNQLVVIGPAPTLKPNTCEVTGHEWNERSIFKLDAPLRVQQKVKARKKEVAKPKPKPKPRPRPAQPQYQPQPQQQWFRW